MRDRHCPVDLTVDGAFLFPLRAAFASASLLAATPPPPCPTIPCSEDHSGGVLVSTARAARLMRSSAPCDDLPPRDRETRTSPAQLVRTGCGTISAGDSPWRRRPHCLRRSNVRRRKCAISEAGRFGSTIENAPRRRTLRRCLICGGRRAGSAGIELAVTLTTCRVPLFLFATTIAGALRRSLGECRTRFEFAARTAAWC